MTTDELAWFENAVAAFAAETGGLIDAVFGPGSTFTVQHTEHRAQPRALMTLNDGSDRVGAPLRVGGVPVAALRVEFGLRPDSSGSMLAVTRSDFVLYDQIDREPLVRLEYRDDMANAPACHWQVHAERGALSHLLTLSSHEKPHRLSALHFPVGGARHRPALEDFLQFLIQECRIDHVAAAMTAIRTGREGWRRRQIRTLVRDAPEEAVASLSRLGYSVNPPQGSSPAVASPHLIDW